MSRTDVAEGHPIQVVARRTGLSADVLRAWEKRYQAVTPRRSETGRRRYTDEDVRRLLLLRRALDLGRSIGQVASLESEELEKLVRTDEEAASLAPLPRDSRRRVAGPAPPPADVEPLVGAALEAIRRLDRAELETILGEALIQLSRPVLLHDFLATLMVRVGDAWREGSLRVSHEHLASAVLRSFVGGLAEAQAGPVAPRLVATTPSGQLHEFGALLAAATAATGGWAATYLGPNLPAEDIVVATRQIDASAVVLSVVHPPGDPRLVDELRRLRRGIGPSVELIVGGAAAPSYASVLEELEARVARDLRELTTILDGVSATRRTRARSQPS